MEQASRDQAALPGLGLVLTLLVIGIVWAAVGFAQRVDVAEVAAASHAALPDMRIDVNSATEAELTLLPGIGPRLAERIVLDREEHGPFTTLSDMTRVTWIGPVIVQRIEPYAFAGE